MVRAVPKEDHVGVDHEGPSDLREVTFLGASLVHVVGQSLVGQAGQGTDGADHRKDQVVQTLAGLVPCEEVLLGPSYLTVEDWGLQMGMETLRWAQMGARMSLADWAIVHEYDLGQADRNLRVNLAHRVHMALDH